MKFQKYDCLSYIAYTNTSCITQFLQPEAEQLLLFRILLASDVLTTSFLKCSAACSWQLQSNKKYRYEIEILKCSSNVRHIWHKILTPCTQCSWRWSQFRIQYLIHGSLLERRIDNSEFLSISSRICSTVCSDTVGLPHRDSSVAIHIFWNLLTRSWIFVRAGAG